MTKRAMAAAAGGGLLLLGALALLLYDPGDEGPGGLTPPERSAPGGAEVALDPRPDAPTAAAVRRPEDIRSPDPQREAAAKLTAALGEHPERARLRSFIFDREQGGDVRGMAVTALAAGAGEDKVRALVELLAELKDLEADAQPRHAALMALGQANQSERARGRLIEALRPAYPSAERRSAMDAMVARGTDWAKPYLERAAASDPDPEVRAHAERSLARVAPKPPQARRGGDED